MSPLRCPAAPSGLRRCVLLAALLLVLAVAHRPASAADRVTLQLKWQHQFQFAGYYAARQQGFYKAEGLDVEIVEGARGRTAATEVLAGRATYGVSDTDVLMSYLHGEPLVLLGVVFQHSPNIILSRRDHSIRTPSGLIGRRLMIDDPTDAQTLALLVREGIRRDRVMLVPHSWRLDDLIAGRVDAMTAYLTVEPEMMRARGVEPAILRPVDYGVDFYGDMLFTSRAEVEAHPDRAKAFRRASFRGWEYAMAHPDEIARSILEMPGVRERGITAEQLAYEARTMRDLVLPGVIEIGHVNPGRLERMADTLASLGFATREHPIADFIFDPDPPRIDPRWLRILLGVIAAGLVLGIVSLGWVIQLRRLVRARTADLQREIEQVRRVEIAQRQSEQHFRQLFERSPVGVVVEGKQGIISANSAFLEMFACSEISEIAGQRFFDLLAPEVRAAAKAHVESRRMGGRSVGHETIGVRASGVPFPFVLVPGQLDPADPNATIYFATDITEQKRLEEQLIQSQKMEAIGLLAGGIAHDFNNLLTAILGCAAILSDELEQGSATHRAATTIERAAERAAELTRQLLGFARRGKFLSTPVDVEERVKEVIGIVERTIDKTVHIATRFEATQHHVIGDPGQIQQIVLNLVLNARDAMPEGGELLIATEVATPDEALRRQVDGLPPGPLLRLSVTDTGVGIPPDIRARIFEPFFTTKGPGRGSGMGLATVYGIVKNHGGAIHCTSEAGRGTRFDVYLPLGATPDRAEPAPAQVARAGRGTILVVDDEDVVRETAAFMLRHLGYDVLLAASSEEAVTIARTDAPIDLALIDMIMPGSDGRACFRALRSVRAGLRAVLSSGYALDRKAQDIVDEGMLGFVPKPYRSTELADALARALAEAPAPRD